VKPTELPDVVVDYWAGGFSHNVPSDYGMGKWRPSLFLPKRFARITLEITGVRVERLQEISEADSIFEGIKRKEMHDGRTVFSAGEGNWSMSPRDSYRAVWESINGPGSWDANPWVWAVEFKRVQGGEV
jgi:hypothetical protein